MHEEPHVIPVSEIDGAAVNGEVETEEMERLRLKMAVSEDALARSAWRIEYSILFIQSGVIVNPICLACEIGVVSSRIEPSEYPLLIPVHVGLYHSFLLHRQHLLNLVPAQRRAEAEEKTSRLLCANV
jgi:hypothetical protein